MGSGGREVKRSDLVSLQQRLGPRHVLGQLLRGHQASDAVDPGHQVSEDDRCYLEVFWRCSGGVLERRPSPEVRQEALQVVGAAQLVLALVGPAHQAAPRRVQLRALLLDVIHGLRVGLDQTLRRLPQRVHLGRTTSRASGPKAHLELLSRASGALDVPLDQGSGTFLIIIIITYLYSASLDTRSRFTVQSPVVTHTQSYRWW